MKKTLLSALLAGITFSAVLASGATYADEGGIRHYAITITNITRGQIIAPPAVIAHNSGYKMFMLGSPGGYELSQLAEAGNGSLVLGAAAAMPSVYRTALGNGGILPGASQTIEIETTKDFSEISVGAMLASTNDGFMAIRGIPAPRRGEVTVMAEAYDAGTEANSESCTFVPGPPCGGLLHDNSPAEGYVHIHAGIHGIGGLSAAMQDWRSAVAQVEIKRID